MSRQVSLLNVDYVAHRLRFSKLTPLRRATSGTGAFDLTSLRTELVTGLWRWFRTVQHTVLHNVTRARPPRARLRFARCLRRLKRRLIFPLFLPL